MKILTLGLAAIVICASDAAAKTVSENRAWTDVYPVAGAAPRLEVSNIWGGVRVRVGEPGVITVSVTESRSAPDQQRFEYSLEVLALDVKADAAGVALKVGHRDDSWWQRKDCHDCRVDYQFDITVPPDAVIDVGTVMDGKVDVLGVTGAISASNVNGPIVIDGVSECVDVGNVNGPITMGFTRAPRQDCRIETVNGDVTLDMPENTSLDVSLDLFNGRVSSELPVGQFELPASVETIVEDGRTRYRIQQLAGIRIGAGGPVYSVASINGDLLIRKHQ
ncbi:MAG: hypothetical protein RLN69_10065 [Woeseiaceae bacterium]